MYLEEKNKNQKIKEKNKQNKINNPPPSEIKKTPTVVLKTEAPFNAQ